MAAEGNLFLEAVGYGSEGREKLSLIYGSGGVLGR